MNLEDKKAEIKAGVNVEVHVGDADPAVREIVAENSFFVEEL